MDERQRHVGRRQRGSVTASQLDRPLGSNMSNRLLKREQYGDGQWRCKEREEREETDG